jgi:hypothetical protein
MFECVAGRWGGSGCEKGKHAVTEVRTIRRAVLLRERASCYGERIMCERRRDCAVVKDMRCARAISDI